MKIVVKFPLSTFLITALFIVLNYLAFSPAAFAINQNPLKDIEIISYNVENLFDTNHDDGKDDWTYLPQNSEGKTHCNEERTPYYRQECLNTNWDEEHFQIKLNQIKDVILKERKNLPDILALVEVENEHVIEALARTLGFSHYVITNSPDHRGVDVAVLFNEKSGFKFSEYREFEIQGDWFQKTPSRNILEVVFTVNGSNPLSLFVNHWPSQANPSSARISAAKLLSDEIDKREEDPNHLVVAVGDFNTIESESPNPIRDVVLGKGSNGLQKMYDIRDQYTQNSEWGCNQNILEKGSYYYKKDRAWNTLDKILISPNLIAGMKGRGHIERETPHANICSFKVYKPDFITQNYKGIKIPKPYDFSANTAQDAGYSDHLPILFKIQL